MKSGRQRIDTRRVVPNYILFPFCFNPSLASPTLRLSLQETASRFFLGYCSPCVNSLSTWRYCTWSNLCILQAIKDRRWEWPGNEAHYGHP